jgi:hypothetical protein
MTQRTRNSAAEAMLNLLTVMEPGGIERQEKLGQLEFVANDTLPIEGTEGENRAAWEKMGFRFGENVDDLFVKVKLPAGWKKGETTHSMWSKIIDDKGRERAAVFYKAAFYDRRAHVHITPRFSVGTDYDHNPHPVVVKDCDIVIHTVGVERKVNWQGDRAAVAVDDGFNRQLLFDGEAWLAERYPSWRDATAHWE